MTDKADKGLVIPEQRAVYVDRNKEGDVMIWQTDTNLETNYIIFRDEHAEAIIAAIRKLVSEND